MGNPRPMRLTDRDLRIFEAIHAYDGMLGAHQIMRLPNRDGKPLFNSWRTTRARLSLLFQHGYIDRLDRRQRAALMDMIYWLTERGAELVAGLQGQTLSDFHWRKQPQGLSMLAHAIARNECRLIFETACAKVAGLELEEWIPEGEFWSRPDEVEYYDERRRKASRRVRPDGYFVIRQFNEGDGQWYRYRMLLEVDRSTEDNPRFVREKVLPGVAYLNSRAYEQRFGARSGRWLIVTTGERRMMNMKRQTEMVAGRDASLFGFTIMSLVHPETVLTEKIWMFGNEDEPRSLFEIS